jgi:hypothetical protein
MSRLLIKEVFAPAIIAASEHTHNLPAGMQREGPWVAKQNHVVNFVEHAIAFAPVAGVAAGYEVFPG